MDNRNTLRSQTVRCAHCGEYYSVTYDYCPFCDAGRKEAEKKKGSLLGSLLGTPEPEKKKKPRSQEKNTERDKRTPRRRDERDTGRVSRETGRIPPVGRETGRIPPVGRETGRIPPVSRETGRIPPVNRETGRIPPVSRETGRIPPVGRETGRIPPVGRETGRIPPVGRETGRIPPVSRDTGRIPREQKEAVTEEPPRRRKKISEMTEEERAANRAQREARAAQRKRERERAAAEAAAKAAREAAAKAAREAAKAAEQGEAPGPVFETMTPPPSFGFEPDSGEHTQPTAHPEAEASGIIRTITIPLKGAGLAAAVAAAAELAETAPETAPQPETVPQEETAPAPPAPAEEELAQSQWAFMRDLEQSSSGTVVEVGGELSDLDQPEAAEEPAQDADGTAPAEPEEKPQAAEAPEEAVQAEPEGLEPPQDAPAPPEPEPIPPLDSSIALKKRQKRVPPPPPPETDPTADEPPGDPDIIIPKIETEEDLDALLAEIREILAEDSPGAAHAKAAEQAAEAAQAEVEEPTKPLPTLSLKNLETGPWQPPVEEPAKPSVPEEDDGEEDEPEEEAFPLSLDAEEEDDEDGEALFLAPDAEKKKKKKRGGFGSVMLVLSIALIAFAVFIVVRSVVPALQSGIFGALGQDETEEPVDTAQTFILNQKDMVFSEPGMTADLVPTFAPEGTTAQLSWSSSNSSVVTVDENGKITTVSPGEATIVASMASGQSAQCQVRCNWTVDGAGNVTPAAPEEGQQPEGGEAGEMVLSDASISMDGPGAARQLTLNGASGEVSWKSSKNSVATVDQNGTVTAVAVGGATITATCNGQSFTCEVRCIW